MPNDIAGKDLTTKKGSPNDTVVISRIWIEKRYQEFEIKKDSTYFGLLYC